MNIRIKDTTGQQFGYSGKWAEPCYGDGIAAGDGSGNLSGEGAGAGQASGKGNAHNWNVFGRGEGCGINGKGYSDES